MSQTYLDKARKVAELFATSFFKVDNPKIVCKGKTKLGYYFTAKPPRNEIITLVVDRTCQLIEMFTGEATIGDIEKGRGKFGEYAAEKDGARFGPAPVIN